MVDHVSAPAAGPASEPSQAEIDSVIEEIFGRPAAREQDRSGGEASSLKALPFN